MIKRFFLAALAAVALTMGFTACSEDEEFGPSGNKYEMNVFLRVNEISSDTAETKQIYETYIKALGITDQEEMTATIQGKDSADCVKTVKNLCAKAEAQLEGQQWSDETAISVSIPAEKNSTVLYSKTFGKAGDNHGGPVPNEYYFTAYKNPIGRTSTDMYVQVQGDKSMTKSAWYWYYHCCDLDLNNAAGGKYVYAMFDQDNTVSLKEIQDLVRVSDHSKELNKYIADVLVLVSDKALTDFHEFTYNGATYKYAHGIYGDPVMWDLNKGAGGPYLYLFYSTDAVHFQRVIDIDRCCFATKYWDNWFDFDINQLGRGPWDVSEFVKGVRYRNGKVTYECSAIDFNKDAGGAYIHMRADYISFDRLKTLSFDEKGYAITDKSQDVEFDAELKAVDLGLSTGTKWANKNVGAYNVEDYGFYFAWGETAPYGKEDTSNAQNYSSTGSYNKMTFEWSTYKWCNGTQIVSKYNQDDYITMLESEDDAAADRLGEHWRTPYKSDIRELIDGCDWTWTTQNGVTGYQVKSKTNGNSIFLPAAGYRSKKDLLGEEDYVYIWSANCDMDVPYRAYYMSRSTKGYNINTEQRYLGLPVRAVYVE